MCTSFRFLVYIVHFSVVPEVHESLNTGTMRANVTIQSEDGELDVMVRSPNGTVFDQWSDLSCDNDIMELDNDELELWFAESLSL